MPSFFVDNKNNLWADGMCYDDGGEYINDAVIEFSFGDPLTTKAITNASNTSPIVITSTAHGRSTGDIVVVANVKGNEGANGTWVITAIDANTFSLDGSVTSGVYVRGGNWWLGLTGGVSLAAGYIAASNGRYKAVLPETAVALTAEKWRLFMFCPLLGVHFEIPFDAVTRGGG